MQNSPILFAFPSSFCTRKLIYRAQIGSELHALKQRLFFKSSVESRRKCALFKMRVMDSI